MPLIRTKKMCSLKRHIILLQYTPCNKNYFIQIFAVPFPPPADVKLVEETHTYLRFNWSLSSSNCPSVYYQIVASNCGHCPNTTVNNTVTCTGNYTATHRMSNRQCSFALQIVVCDDVIGDTSIAVTTSFAGILIIDKHIIYVHIIRYTI